MRETANALLNAQKVSDRIIIAHFNGNPNLSVISVYAPTNCDEEINKDTFYEDLNKAITSIPSHNLTIVLGDFNAQVDLDRHLTNPRIVGQYTFHHESNENGQRLIDLCESNNLRLAHGRFKHRKGRLWTWEHPNHNLNEPHAQLDHIIINGKWVNSLRNCRAYNSVEVDSDHRIVCARIDISLRSNTKNQFKRKRFNIELLKYKEYREKFNANLQNRFGALEIENTQIQKMYDEFESTIESTCTDVLGIRPKRNCPGWVSAKTIELLDRRDKAKRIFQSRRTHATRKAWRELVEQVNIAYQNDEKANLERQLDRLELAAEHNNIKRTWDIVNEISGKKVRKPTRVKKLDGNTPRSTKEVLDEWKQYFEKLLNGPNKSTATLMPPPAQHDLNINDSNFCRDEIDEAIELLNDNKAAGIDNSISAEVIKRGGEHIRTQLLKICQTVYETNTAPKQWTTNIIVPVPKEGNLQLMTNYRGISLMSIAAKVYNRMLLNRIYPKVDKLLRPNQAGFRKGRSCIQQIHILRRIIDGARLRHLPLSITFIDFKKAFDSIKRDVMFAILRHYGIPEKLVFAIKSLYDNSTSKVYYENQLSNEFSTQSGVLQGDVLAPFLFVIVIDYIMRNSDEAGFLTQPRESSRKPEQRLNDLDYADDN